MLDFIKEDSIWNVLKRDNRPIFIYGIGLGASKIMKVCDDREIKITGIFSSDKYIKGHKFAGFDVLRYDDVKSKYDDFIVLLAFGVNTAEVFDHIDKISKEVSLFVPDVPVFGDGIFDLEFVRENQNKLSQVYDILEDEHSKLVYENVINFKISGKHSYLRECETSRKEISENIFSFKNNEIFVDAGAYTGDTLKEFLENVSFLYEKIYLIEPDSKNFKRLMKNVSELNLNNVECINLGLWDSKSLKLFDNRSSRASTFMSGKGELVSVDALDSIIGDNKVTCIKYDVEGAESQALAGSQNLIQKYKPMLEVAAYHRNEDIFKLPLIVKGMDEKYKIFLRHHPYLPAWETNLYAKI